MYLRAGLGLTLLVGLYLTSLYSYLLFHSLVELFSIIVACGIFMFAWNSRRFMANDYLLYLGIAYLFVAALDLVHTLAYKGMNVFPGFGADLPTQLWIAARYLESLTFLAAAFFFTRKVRPYAVFGAYSAVLGLLLVSIFGGMFPVCYVDGQGLTLFKKVSEYIISALFLTAIYVLYRHQGRFHVRVYRLLIASLVLTIGSELAFTFYINVYGLSNLIGHIFKLISFYLIYEAVIATGLRAPYDLMFKQLEDSRQNLERRVRDRTADLNERRLELTKRVQELTCLYAVSDLLQRVPGEEHLQEVVELIPTGWQRPELTCARLTLDGQTFLTPNWTETDWKQVSPVMVHGQETGRIEVCLDTIAGDAGPFWRQEQSLLNAIAAQLGRFIESQRARDELRRAKDFTETVLNSLNDEVSIIDPVHYTIVEVNESYLARAGLTRDQVIGRRCHELTYHLSEPCAGPNDFCPVRETLASGKAVSAEHIHHLPDGDPIHVEITTSPMMSPDGRVVRVVHVCRDVTDRRRLEEQFLQAQKMEAVGRLAGGVAHDFNNLLTIISGYSDMALAGLSPGDSQFEGLTQINEAGRRAADLTRQLLAFSRKQVLQSMPLDLGVILTNIEKMLKRMIGEDIELVAHSEPDLGTVLADPGQIEQVIMNLAVNAKDAMPDGGKLTLEAGNVILDETYVRSHPEATVGPHVMLAVTDTGSGMDEMTRNRIFEPFFTTKDKGRGTGLGLATVYGIVKQSGGNIFVYSEPGQGTTFKLYLPRVDEAAASLKADQAEDEVPGGSETILVVEDEDTVRDLICRVLEDRGYRVEEAAGGEEALAMAHGLEIHLVLTDVVMPGLNGPDLVRRLIAEHPGIKVLYTSGYADHAVARNGLLEPGVNLISKPMSPASLARKVREVLDAGRQR